MGERRKTESAQKEAISPSEKGRGERPNKCVVRGRERIEEGANLLNGFFCSREEKESKTLRFCFSFVKGPCCVTPPGLSLTWGEEERAGKKHSVIF